jgi:hypothetical protein
MPIVEFAGLPDSARTWVYGADHELKSGAETQMLEEVDRFLAGWRAHGAPLYSARQWDEGRFLTIAVDSTQENASGCSIDVLYRTLKSLEPTLGAHIVTSGLVYYRGRDGEIHSVTRDGFSDLSSRGEIDGDTEVFDLSVTTLGEWRARFKSRAVDSWHAALMSEHV